MRICRSWTIVRIVVFASIIALVLMLSGCEWVGREENGTPIATLSPSPATTETTVTTASTEPPPPPVQPEPAQSEPVQSEPVVRPHEVHVVPEQPGVGETFVVAIDPGTDGPWLSVTGTFGTGPTQRQLHFVPVDTQWTAVVSVSYWLEKGDYPLHIDYQGVETTASDDLEVPIGAREFPEQRLTVSNETAAIKTDDSLAEDSVKTSAARSSSRPLPLWDGPFIQPVEGRITTEFGMTRYVNGEASGHHSGLDIAAPEGRPVLATNRGIVVLAEKLNVTGNTIIIDHGMNIFSSYAHLSKLDVEVGDRVERGEVIGEVGSTGFSTGPHLHWTMMIENGPTNPWLFLDPESPLARELQELQYRVNPEPRLR